MKTHGLCFLIAGLLLACESVVELEDRFPNGRLAKAGRLVGGEQDGPWTYYYESGSLKARGPYREDLQEGLWTYWFPNGEKEMEGELRDERRVGLWRYWYANGPLRAEGQFEDGRETGEWRFGTEEGQLHQRGHFQRGKQHLRWTVRSPDGSLRASGFYFEGKRVGPWEVIDDEDQLLIEDHPTPPGVEPYSESWPDGTPRREGFLHDDVPSGLWITRHENGELRLSGQLEDGLPIGTWRAFDTEGELLAAGDVDRGRLVGRWQMRSELTDELAPREIGPRPPAIAVSEWSLSTDDVEAGPVARVETWLAEMRSPLEAERWARESAVTEVSPSLAPAADMRRAPIKPQPWTVREEDLMSAYVEQYPTGDSPRLRRTGLYGSPEPRRERGDREKSERLVGRALPVTEFETAERRRLDLARFRGEKKLLVVILRGFAGQVCVYCATQTKALAPSLSRFEALDTEVVIVYPGPESGLDAFVEAYVNTFNEQSPPLYTLLYDPDLRLAEELGLTGNLAIPTSLIVDESGVIRWAYVGRSIDDRPTTRQILEVLGRM